MQYYSRCLLLLLSVNENENKLFFISCAAEGGLAIMNSYSALL